MTDAISVVAFLHVAGVFPERDPLGLRKSQQSRFRLIQEWPDQLDLAVEYRRADPLHSAQTFTARSPEKAQKKKLGLVIGVMGQSHGRNFQPLGGTAEKVMPQIPGGHLDGQLLPVPVAEDVASFNHARESQTSGGDLDELFIGIAFHAAKLMIEVGHDQTPVMPGIKPMQQMKQHHGVHPARNGDEDGLPTDKKIFAKEGCFDLTQQVAHAVML